MADKDKGMDKATMRKLLVASKTEPVNCAVAQGDEPAVALLMLHKTKPARSLERSLKEDFPSSKNHRFGTAFVDVDDNPKLVKFTLNKPVSGMARRLIKTLKGTGFSKVLILLEDGTEVETHEEAEENETVAPGVTASATPDDRATASPSAPPPPPVAPPPPDQAANADKLKQLQALLAQLAPQIPKAAGEDATRKAELLKLATDANTNLKTGNLVYAATYLAQLKTAIETPAAGATSFAKSRLSWVSARQKIEAELDKLAAELGKAYAEEPMASQVKTAYAGKTAGLLQRFDARLPKALDDLIENGDAGKREALVGEARNAAKDLLALVDSDPLVNDLDDNPFVPLALRNILVPPLNEIAGNMK